MDELNKTIEPFLPREPEAPAVVKAPADSPVVEASAPLPVVLREALEVVGEDVDILRDAVATSLEKVPGQLQELEDAMARQDAKGVEAKAHRPKGVMGKLRILCVDDDRPTVTIISSILKKEGYEVEVALDGNEGLKKARAIKPDLIIMDIMMPGMDGYQVTQRLKADPDTAKIGVIMLTARGGVDENTKEAWQLATRVQDRNRGFDVGFGILDQAGQGQRFGAAGQGHAVCFGLSNLGTAPLVHRRAQARPLKASRRRGAALAARCRVDGQLGARISIEFDYSFYGHLLTNTNTCAIMLLYLNNASRLRREGVRRVKALAHIRDIQSLPVLRDGGCP
jgi:CheY-like chemotaxis protein